MPSIKELLAFYQDYVDHRYIRNEPSLFENPEPEPDPEFNFTSDRHKGKKLEPRRFASLHKMIRENPTIEFQVESALGQLYDALANKEAGFQGPWEVEEFIGGWQPMMPESRSSELQQIEATLAEPAPHWKFTIPVFRANNALSTTRGTDSDEGNWLLGDLGGRSVLSVRGDDRLFPSGAVLTGRISARTRRGAVVAAENLALAWIGAAHALELLDYQANALFLGTKATAEPAMAGIGAEEEDETPQYLTGPYLDVLSWMWASIPGDLSELELRHLREGNTAGAVERSRRLLRDCMLLDTAQGEQMRSACRLAALARASIDFGVALSLAFSVVEGLLLDPDAKSDVCARLAEAATYALGTSRDHREGLRKSIKALYEHRSVFVHTGSAGEVSKARESALGLMNAVLRHEIGLLVAARQDRGAP